MIKTLEDIHHTTHDLEALGRFLSMIGRQLSDREHELSEKIISGATVTTLERYKELTGRLAGLREGRQLIQECFEKLLREMEIDVSE